MCKYSEKGKQLSGVVQLPADSRKRDEVVRRQGLSRWLPHLRGSSVSMVPVGNAGSWCGRWWVWAYVVNVKCECWP